MTATHAPVLIIGSGPAGYTAAIYAARAMLEPVLISGMQQGGQLMITTDVENYPGFADPIQGPWLMEQMLKQAEHVGARIVVDLVNDVDLDQRPFRVSTDSGAVYTCDALIVATGAQAHLLVVRGQLVRVGLEAVHPVDEEVRGSFHEGGGSLESRLDGFHLQGVGRVGVQALDRVARGGLALSLPEGLAHHHRRCLGLHR